MLSRTFSLGAVAFAVACGGGSTSSGTGGAHTNGGSAGSSHQNTGGADRSGGHAAGGDSGATGGTGGAGGDSPATGGAGGSHTGGASGNAGGNTGGSQAVGGSQAKGGTTTTASGGTAGAANGGAGGSTGTAGATGATGGAQGNGGTSGGLSTNDPNVVAVTVDSGPDGSMYINGPFATITLCEPGTNNCQTIDHLLIDTGSTGIRVLESVVKLKLPAATGPSGKSMAECLPFMSGSSWGPVKSADFKIGGESASKMRVQLIGELTYPMDADCAGTPITDLDTLGSNGILGIGLNVEDCGTSCASTGPSNPGLYYECTSNKAGGCSAVAVPLAEQIANPIASFAVDNNGSFFRFPAIPAAGAETVDGFLVFGIGTRSNNGLGNAKVISVDDYGFAVTVFPAGGTKYRSFIDSGSNGIYFLDSTTTKIATCTTGSWSGFYCPQNAANLTASITAKDGSAAPVAFSVGNAGKFSMSYTAFSNLAAPMLDSGSATITIGFDWGFPFYYGRTVFTAIEKKDTPGGSGPYFAF